MDVHDWLNTQSALSDLKFLLLCGVCEQMVRQPCTLGGCEHIFCLECVDDLKGSVCPICGVPSHVKDVQTDRQLDTAATLCRQLSRLINAHDVCDGGQDAADSVGDVTHKEYPDNEAVPIESLLTHSDHLTASQYQLCNAADDDTDSPPISRRTRKKVKVEKGKRILHQANKTWDIGGDDVQKCSSCKKSRQRVLFHDQHSGGVSKICDKCDEVDAMGSAEGMTDTYPCKIDLVEKISNKDDIAMCTIVRKQERKAVKNLGQPTHEPGPEDCEVSKGDDSFVQLETANKKELLEACKSSSMKMSKTKNHRNVKVKNTRVSQQRNTPKSKTSPSFSDTSVSNSTPKSSRNKSSIMGLQPWVSPSVSSSQRLKSGLINSPSTMGSPAISKKNPKGETPLHVACIKGDLDKVKHLLDEGAVANTRDNAGWTPLHEACNHGNTRIAELLLDAGAKMNIAGGPENDSPLHDAVTNYKLSCVELLVSRGASLTQRNLIGKTPVDLATNDAMKKALGTPVKTECALQTQPDLAEFFDMQQVVVIATGLDREQKNRVQKCAQMLHGKMATDFSPSVSHVVTSVNSDGMCPRTLKYLHAVLVGKWIVNMDWVETCLEYADRVSEEPFEVPGASSSPNSMAPYRARHNYIQQLPGLYAGCQFYLRGDLTYPAPSKEDLSALIKAADGVFITREPRLESINQSDVTIPYHAVHGSQLESCSHFIIQDKIKCGKLIGSRLAQVPPSWIMDCIAQFKITDLPNKS